MRGWLLDTNVIASLASDRGAPSVQAWAAGQDERRFFLSILTLAEYDKGVHQLADDDPARGRYELIRDSIERRFSSRILPMTTGVLRRWGALTGRIRRDTGHPPPVIDTLMAATALENGLYLVTRNVRDVAYSGAAVFNPWTDEPSSAPLLRG